MRNEDRRKKVGDKKGENQIKMKGRNCKRKEGRKKTCKKKVKKEGKKKKVKKKLKKRG